MVELSVPREETGLPADFDAEWYAARYPDVALSQLDPGEHYLKFGRLLGRLPNARVAAEEAAAAPAGQGGVLPMTRAKDFGRGPLPAAEARPLRNQADSPLIAGPEDLKPGRAAASGGAELPPDTGAPRLLAGPVEVARLAGTLAPDAVLAPVAAYSRMLGFADPARLIAPEARGAPLAQTARRLAELARQRPTCGAAGFAEGAVRLANAWFADEGRLRLALAGSESQEEHVVHVFQSLPHDPAQLMRIGSARLGGPGPGFCDAEVLNPLMPVLMVQCSAAGLALASAVLPFPSLLRGGLHAAERAAYQSGPNPMDDVWRLSEALIGALLAEPYDPPPAISALTVDLTGATGAERLASAPVRQWLRAIFGLGLAPAPGQAGAAALAWGIPEDDPPAPRGGRDTRGLTLQLPADGLPTLSALTARTLRLPEGRRRAAGPYLVAQAVSGRPLWSVALPLSETPADDTPGLPLLLAAAGTETKKGAKPPAAPGTAEPSGTHWLAPLHLAIRLTGAEPEHDAVRLMPVAPDAPRAPVQATALSVVLRAGDPDRVQTCLEAVARQEGVRIAELLICHDATLGAGAVEALQALGDRLCAGEAALMALPAGRSVDLAAAAERTSGAELCLIRDDVTLHDPRTLGELRGILAADPTAATASCALLYEEVVKKAVELRVASAGLFPSHVSLIAAPRLGVAEPDCLAALPQATYPVLANAFGLCLVRRAAVEAVGGGSAGPAGAHVADLKFGLDLAARGWRSLCTTRVRAGTVLPPQRRDEIDPFGLAAVLPAAWDTLLSRVTVLQQLRG